MNPVTVRIYDLNHNKVTTKFLEMCACPSSTVEALFNTFDTRLSSLLDASNPLVELHLMWSRQHFSEYWHSIKTRVLKKMVPFAFNGCPCHIIHNAGQKLEMHLLKRLDSM